MTDFVNIGLELYNNLLLEHNKFYYENEELRLELKKVQSQLAGYSINSSNYELLVKKEKEIEELKKTITKIQDTETSRFVSMRTSMQNRIHTLEDEVSSLSNNLSTDSRQLRGVVKNLSSSLSQVSKKLIELGYTVEEDMTGIKIEEPNYRRASGTPKDYKEPNLNSLQVEDEIVEKD